MQQLQLGANRLACLKWIAPCGGRQRTRVKRTLTAMSVRAEVDRKELVSLSCTLQHACTVVLPDTNLLLYQSHQSASAARSSRCRAEGTGGRAPALDGAE